MSKEKVPTFTVSRIDKATLKEIKILALQDDKTVAEVLQTVLTKGLEAYKKERKR